MSSSSSQSNSSSPSPAPSSAPPGHQEITFDGHRALSQLEITTTLGHVSSTPLVVPATKLQLSHSASGTLRVDIFPENVIKPIYKTNLPKPNAPVDETPQLVYCFSLLPKVSQPFEPTLDSDVSQDSLLDDEEKGWVQLIDPALQDRYRWLIEQLVKAFADNALKPSDVVAEIVLVAPILDRNTYRSLLSSFISKLEQTTTLDTTLLQGLVQMVECASSGYLVDDDLVRIATVLSKELSVIHIGTSDHPWHLTLSLARVLDVMVAGKVKDLNRERAHQPILQLLDGLKNSDNVVQRYEAIYASQALQYALDDETPLQVLWRYAKVAAAGAGAVSSVFKLDPEGLLKGIESLQEIGAGVVGAVSTGIEVAETLRVGAGGLVRASENEFDLMKKCSWYLALQGTALFIRKGRLSDFNQVVSQAPCRRSANFQWGICRQLGEIAVDPLWDACIRQRAVDFLGELFRSCADWKPHVDVKRWILTILVQISGMSDVSVKDRAVALLLNLKKDDTTEFPGSYPLSSRLPLPSTSPLLTKVQEIPRLEYNLHVMRLMRIAEYKQAVYIDPMAKLSLQDTDDNLFPLMDKVRDFLASDAEVMLVLGDSGAGKSTFNRHLEHELWQEYKPGGRIPLFVNLPSLERPDRNMVEEQLRIYNFMDDHIRELKVHRQFTLICDGYDESQLTSNLHTSNLFNRPGQWNVKLLITCRTQYLGSDYQSRFEPGAGDPFANVANDLFQQAVIAPFSKEQIKDYVERYVPLEPRTWVKKDYMDKLEAVPNLMDLVRNPFLLTLSLEALPTVVKGKADLSRLRVTRAELYDTFVRHWMAVNKRRLNDQRLDKENQTAFEELLEAGFEQSGVKFQQDLAAAIFIHQDGRPIVDYINKLDSFSWKFAFFSFDCKTSLLRDASLLSRAGTQFRFVHRSILEYFFSCTVCGPIDYQGEVDSHSPVFSDTSVTSPTISAHPLSQRSLVVEHSIIQFLAERVQLDSRFKDELLAIIELSKTDDQAAHAATNAITILVRANVSFNGADLRGVRIPGADLSVGEFDSVQFQGADLTAVNLTKSWIRQADFSNVVMPGVQFGEWPFLSVDKEPTACAYSNDGNALAVGLTSGDINIYDTATWTRTLTLSGHFKAVTGLSYNPTGHQLFSASRDGTLRVWNPKSGLSEQTLGGQGGVVSSIAVYPNGQQLATGGTDKLVRLWFSHNLSPSHCLQGHIDAVTCLAFSPDGSVLASGSSDKTIRLWATSSGDNTFILKGHTDSISSIAYAPNGRHFVSGSNDTTVRVWDVSTENSLAMLTSHTDSISSIAYAPNGQHSVSGSNNITMRVWDVSTENSLAMLTDHTDRVSSVAYSPDGQYVVSASWDKTVRIWHWLSPSDQVSVLRGATKIITGLSISPAGLAQVAACCNDKTVRLWDATPSVSETFAIGTVAESNGHIGGVSAIAISHDCQQLAIGGYDTTVRTLDPTTGHSLGSPLCAHKRSVAAVAFSPTIQILVSASWDHTIHLWDTGRRELSKVIHGHLASVTSLAFLPSGHLISGSADWTIRLWNLSLDSQEPMHTFKGHTQGVRSVACSHDGFRIASASEDKTVRVWTLTAHSGKTEDVFEGHSDVVACVTFSPNGRQIASASEDKSIRLWNIERSGSEPTVLLGHRAGVQCVAYSTCGTFLASGSDDSSVIVWSVLTNSIMTIIGDVFGGISSIVWKQGGLIVGCKDGSVRAWRLLVEEDRVQVRLEWGTGFGYLVATDAHIGGALKLGSVAFELLKQRGAVG